MAVLRSAIQPLSVQIESWPHLPALAHEWAEIGLQGKRKAVYSVCTTAPLRYEATSELKISSQEHDSLRKVESDHIRFTAPGRLCRLLRIRTRFGKPKNRSSHQAESKHENQFHPILTTC